MRVLHLTAGATRRGAEVFAADLERALARRGVSQRVAALRGSGVAEAASGSVTFLSEQGRRAAGLNLDVRAVMNLRSMIRSWRPDVVQAHGGEAMKHAIAASVATPARVVYRRIGMASPWAGRGPRRFAHAILMRRSAKIVAVADAVARQTMSTFRVPSARVVTIPNGVDAERVRSDRSRELVREDLGIPVSARVILSLGALVWEKDPLAHVAVSDKVLRAVPDALHLFVGDGQLRDEVIEAVRVRGLEGRVRLLGVRSDVADVLAASDVVLVASKSDGMPANVIEAGMAGVPVAGFAVAGIPEVVVDGTTGFLVPPDDVDGLAAATVRLLEDDQLRHGMGEAARQHCLARFEIGPVAGRYLDVYEEVAAE